MDIKEGGVAKGQGDQGAMLEMFYEEWCGKIRTSSLLVDEG